jgi:hypothetical protein
MLTLDSEQPASQKTDPPNNRAKVRDGLLMSTVSSGVGANCLEWLKGDDQ